MSPADALEVMQLLSDCFPGRVAPATVQAWAMAIAPYEKSVALLAVAKAARECEHPSLVALVERMGEEKPKDRGALQFDEVRKAIGAHGSYRSVDFADRATNAAIRAMGGWVRLCLMDAEEFEKWGRKEFERLYALYSASGAAEGESGNYLVGIIEQTNAPRGYEIESPVRIGIAPLRHPSLSAGRAERPPPRNVSPPSRTRVDSVVRQVAQAVDAAPPKAPVRRQLSDGHPERAAVAGERVILQTEAEADARRAELMRQAAELGGEEQ